MNKQYARAFFDIVMEEKTLNEAKESFDVFVDVLNSNSDFALVLNSPKIKVEDKKELIKKTFTGCLEDFILFLYVVLDNGRIEKILGIYSEFTHLYNEQNKIKVVDVISVNKLTEEENIKLLNSLKKYYNGYEVILHNKIDSSVVGGYHILVNGISMDLSIKRKIDDLQNHILN